MSVFNEDTRVKIPATIQFLRLGYEYQSLNDENINIDFNTKIFKERFRKNISKINDREISKEECNQIIDDIHSCILNNDLGKTFHEWLVNPFDRVKLIDFDNFENNNFAVVDELPYSIKEDSEAGSFRPDINILINGMPLAFLEVKKPNNDGGIQAEFDRMIKKRLKKAEHKKHFNMLQVISFSNNMEYEDPDDAEDVKAGSFYSTPNGNLTTFSFFREDSEKYHALYPIKNINMDYIKEITEDLGYDSSNCDTPEFHTNLDKNTPCNRFITSMFDKERLLFFIHYGIVFIDGEVKERHIMRYPQFFASLKTLERLENGGKKGIIWHTQGSGKTALASFENKILHDYYAKKGINSRFFFVVDRLDLLRQASTEFKMRGLSVIECNSRAEFTRELSKPLALNADLNSNGEVCVVNIQKFESDIPKAKNDYNINCQRVFFVDEAHRSYSKNGEFFKNLMTCDKDAIYIALTGTPLLSQKERSNLKFGDYIHKYFYDKSIADGYTLRIKKENIDTKARAEIKNNLELENKDLNSKDVYESDDYIECLGAYIKKDFKNFRIQNGDNTIGGMIVCRSNLQAKKMWNWFEENYDSNSNTDIRAGLVISDESDPDQSQRNKNNQIDFRKNGKPDILIVNFMLTTGYDVKRLKKMYLLRGPHAQSLLQTISRVNRPYISPITGKAYKYGYITDFVDIKQEYDRTLAAYLKELEQDFNEDTGENGSLQNLIVDKEVIKDKYDKLTKELEDLYIPTENLEIFSRMLDRFNISTLRTLKRILDGMNECYIELVLSNADEYVNQIDIKHINALRKETKNKINFINLKDNAVSVLDVISNDEVVEIMYEFIKTKVIVLNLKDFDLSRGKRLTEIVTDVQNEIKANKNKDDTEIIKLNELLQKVFDKMNVMTDIEMLEDIEDELIEILEKAKKINEENDKISEKYDGHFALVKTYQDITANYNVDKSDIEKAMLLIYEEIKDDISVEALTGQGLKNFSNYIKEQLTMKLFAEDLFDKIEPIFDELLTELYKNIQIYR